MPTLRDACPTYGGMLPRNGSDPPWGRLGCYCPAWPRQADARRYTGRTPLYWPWYQSLAMQDPDQPQTWPSGYRQAPAGFWFSHPREGRCIEGQVPGGVVAHNADSADNADNADDTDGADDAPCTWRRAPLALSLRMQDLYSRGWNATYDSSRQYDVPLEQVQQNAAILEAAFADVAASRFAGGGRAALSCAIA